MVTDVKTANNLSLLEYSDWPRLALPHRPQCARGYPTRIRTETRYLSTITIRNRPTNMPKLDAIARVRQVPEPEEKSQSENQCQSQCKDARARDLLHRTKINTRVAVDLNVPVAIDVTKKGLQ